MDRNKSSLLEDVKAVYTSKQLPAHVTGTSGQISVIIFRNNFSAHLVAYGQANAQVRTIAKEMNWDYNASGPMDDDVSGKEIYRLTLQSHGRLKRRAVKQ